MTHWELVFSLPGGFSSCPSIDPDCPKYFTLPRCRPSAARRELPLHGPWPSCPTQVRSVFVLVWYRSTLTSSDLRILTKVSGFLLHTTFQVCSFRFKYWLSISFRNVNRSSMLFNYMIAYDMVVLKYACWDWYCYEPIEK